MDNLTKEQRRKNMQNIRSKGTKPELLVMKELRRRKIYFASHVNTIIGKPDIVFRRKKVAVFIDSDFWHKHPTRFIQPKTNKSYWVPKIENNVKRDRWVNRMLRKDGWKVLRVWESNIKGDLNREVNGIVRAIGNNFI